jgi:hypothetical protein
MPLGRLGEAVALTVEDDPVVPAPPVADIEACTLFIKFMKTA